MVPEREKDLLRHVRGSSKTFSDLRTALETILTEKNQGPSPMDIGNIEGPSDHRDGAVSDAPTAAGTGEIEVENPESGEVEIFRLGVSGQWSKTGVRQRKKPGLSSLAPEAPRRKRTAEEIKKGECFRCG